MIEKTPTIYKSGLTKDDVKSIIAEETKNNYEWIDITNKLGNKTSSGIIESSIIIKYNKNSGLVYCKAYVYFSSNSSSIRRIFDFNQDIPGGAQGEIHVFSAEPLAYCGGNPSILGIIKFYPHYMANTTVSFGISVDAKNYVEANGNMIAIVNKDVIDAFNEYLGM